MSGTDDSGKKEKVIHTRIPAALEEQIKRAAEALRVPVSNLVRNMLEDAIHMTKTVRDSLPGARGHAVEARQELADVFGWQALTLNVATPCASCAKALVPGDEAYLGLTDRQRDHQRVFICSACLPRPGATSTAKTKE